MKLDLRVNYTETYQQIHAANHRNYIKLKPSIQPVQYRQDPMLRRSS